MALPSNCWKYLVLCYNVLFAMSALVLFGGSCFLLYRLFVYRHFIGIHPQYPVILMLMMSIITCSVAWIGWRTTKSMHHFHVIAAGILIFLVVAVEFGCFVWAMVIWGNLEVDLRMIMIDYFKATVLQKKDDNLTDFTRWDKLHVQMKCCGVSGPQDYANLGPVSTNGIPFSCCGQGPLDSIHGPYSADCSVIYQRGCGLQLLEYIQQQMLIVAGTALSASVLQSTGIFCTFFLANSITKSRRASIALRSNNSKRESGFSSPDDSLLQSPTAPAPTLPKSLPTLKY